MKPFLRWVGGKRRLAAEVVKRFPEGWERMVYCEPFLGSGAVLLSLGDRLQQRPVLGDQSEHLVEAWRYADPDLVRHYGAGVVSGESYREVRAAYNSGVLAPVQRASLFVVLNHTCFNGLWRVSGRGKMNVPWGKRSPDWDEICAAMRKVLDDPYCAANEHGWRDKKFECSCVRRRVACEDFGVLLGRAGKNWLAYLDPPYHGAFTDYTARGFGWEDQVRLAAHAASAAQRGAVVVASLPDEPEVRELWSMDFSVEEVEIVHAVAADGKRRTPKRELIARSR